MITYKMSSREKALLLALALVVIAILWFVFVYQGTTNEVIRLEGEISERQAMVEYDTARVAQMERMREAIDTAKAAGVRPTTVPEYDNMRLLMEELNSIMAAAAKYTISFDQIKTNEENEYIDRGVRIDFTCGSYDAAESIVAALAGGSYPCVVDSVSINDRYSATSGRDGGTTASVHVTFFEKQPSGNAASGSEDGSEGGSAGSAADGTEADVAEAGESASAASADASASAASAASASASAASAA